MKDNITKILGALAFMFALSIIFVSLLINSDKVGAQSPTLTSTLQPADRFQFPLGAPSGVNYGPAANNQYGVQNPSLGTVGKCFMNIEGTQVPFNTLYHAGTDWFEIGGNAAGDDVNAIANGRVIYISASIYPGFVVIIQHQLPSGEYYYSQYGHLVALTVVINDVVGIGEKIGEVLDQEDNSHIHWEVRDFAPTPGANGTPVFNLYPSNSAGGRNPSGNCNKPYGVGYNWDDLEYRKPPNYWGYTHPEQFVRAHQEVSYLPILEEPYPTSTYTPTSTPTSTPTPTITPFSTVTPTWTHVPTRTPTLTPTKTPYLSPTPCTPPGCPGNLALTQTTPALFRVNHSGTFQFTITNLGPHPATDIVLVDTLPADVIFLSAFGTGWGCYTINQTTTCSHPGPLNAGESLPLLTVNIKPKPAAVPSVTNTASVSHADIDPDSTNNQSTLITPVRALPASDFDGDGDADISVFRNGSWLILSSGTPFTLGQAGDIPVPGDYDADGVVQPAVFRPSTGTWYICTANFDAPNCPYTTTTFGLNGDIPVPADYDGDGDTDIAVFRPGNATWYISGSPSVVFGLSTDKPVPADYDGDGDADLAIFRNGSWRIQGMANSTLGQAGDIPVPADYDGDGIADKAVFRPSAGKWWVCKPGSCPEYTFGQNGDIPVPADYDGSGRAQMAVFRPGNTTWYIYQGNSTVFGQSTDIPTLKRPSYSVYPY